MAPATRHKDPVPSGAFFSFQRNYAVISLLGAMADSLQGPYQWPLLQEYQMLSAAEAARLIAHGNALGAVLGVLLAAVADRKGRARWCAASAAMHAASALTKSVPNAGYSNLLLAQLLKAASKALLFCGFEAWMVQEHRTLGFEDAWLGSTFGEQ